MVFLEFINITRHKVYRPASEVQGFFPKGTFNFAILSHKNFRSPKILRLRLTSS